MNFIITLTFLSSLAGQPSPEKQIIPWDGSLMQCQLYGQQAITSWLAEHPGRQLIFGYRCVIEPIGERAA